MPDRRGAGLLYGLVAVNVGIEAVLTAADLGLWAGPGLRQQVFAAFAFDPAILAGAAPAFPGQTSLMFMTYAFVHGGLGHLAGNMIGLLALGKDLLRSCGILVFGLVYVAATLAGGGAYALLAPDGGWMVGASGAIFGLAGALAWVRRGQLVRITLELVAMNFGLWLLLGGYLAWQAHLGGFLAGLAVAAAAAHRGSG